MTTATDRSAPTATTFRDSRILQRISNNQGLIVRIVLAALLFMLLVSPMVPIVYQGFLDKPLYDDSAAFTLANFGNLFSDPRFINATENTLIIGFIGTAISTSVGFLSALFLDRFDLPFQRTLRMMFLSPMFLSSLIMAFAWSMMYSPTGFIALWLKANLGFGLPNLNSILGISLLAGVSAAPVSYIYFSAAHAEHSEHA